LLNELAVEIRTARRVLFASTRPPCETETAWLAESGLRADGGFFERINVRAGELDRYFTLATPDAAGK
jgi:hypothetical protein